MTRQIESSYDDLVREVVALRAVVRAMHERIIRGGPRNYDQYALEYFTAPGSCGAYWRAMADTDDEWKGVG